MRTAGKAMLSSACGSVSTLYSTHVKLTHSTVDVRVSFSFVKHKRTRWWRGYLWWKVRDACINAPGAYLCNGSDHFSLEYENIWMVLNLLCCERKVYMVRPYNVMKEVQSFLPTKWKLLTITEGLDVNNVQLLNRAEMDFGTSKRVVQ